MDNAQQIAKAVKRCKLASIFAFVSAVITAAFGIAGLFFEPTESTLEPLAYWLDPFILLDAVVILALGLAVRAKSRIASISLIIYWIVSVIVALLETGQVSSLLVNAIFLYVYCRGAIGAFQYHNLKPTDEQNAKGPASSWMTGIAISFLALVVIAVAAFVVMANLPSSAPIEVLFKEDIHPAHRKVLIDLGIVEETDEILALYSTGIISIKSEGSLLTQTAVIGYDDWSGELEIYSFPYADISEIQIDEYGDFLNDTIVAVEGNGDENWIFLILSAENGGDRKFIDLLEEKTGLTAIEPVPLDLTIQE